MLFTLSATLSSADFLSWGWRVAFWLSAVIVLVGYYIRTKVTDAPIFLEAQKEVTVEKKGYGVGEVFRRYPRGVFTAMGLRFAENILYYLVVTFSITYLKVIVQTDTSRILLLLLVAHFIHFAVIPHGRHALRPLRPQAGLHGRRHPRRHLGLLRLPDDGHQERPHHPRGDHHRSAASTR